MHVFWLLCGSKMDHKPSRKHTCILLFWNPSTRNTAAACMTQGLLFVCGPFVSQPSLKAEAAEARYGSRWLATWVCLLLGPVLGVGSKGNQKGNRCAIFWVPDFETNPYQHPLCLFVIQKRRAHSCKMPPGNSITIDYGLTLGRFWQVANRVGAFVNMPQLRLQC